MHMRGSVVGVLIAGTLIGLSACGGGGGSSLSTSGSSSSSSYTPGVYKPEATFAARCVAPRSGKDPYTNAPFPDMQGTSVDENNWLRSWTNDLYLWYSEVPDLNPASYDTAAHYFPVLKTSAKTASGNPKDRFHFTYPTSVWESLSQSNTDVGYGVQFEILQNAPPRQVVIVFVEQGSAASQPPASVARGATVLAIDGVDIDSSNTDALDAGLSPATAGETHTFQIRDEGSTSARTVTLQSASVTTKSVPDVHTIATSSGTVGYLLFNNQLAQAEGELITAVNTLKSAGITDLILDIRYNGGGYLDIASELAYMIADPNMTGGQTFELVQFNGKHPSTDPVTGNPITPVGFHTTTQGLSSSVPRGQALPNLGLQRVFVLTTSATCSASESVMNSLQGVGIQVVQIGSTTCGKPYGFYPADNCGTTYFSIQFQGVNARSFGGYPDGFTPSSSMSTSSGTSATLPGCSVADDFTHALGDQNESLLFVALGYRTSPTCSVPPAGLSPGMSVKRMNRTATQGQLVRSPMREIRILRSSSR